MSEQSARDRAVIANLIAALELAEFCLSGHREDDDPTLQTIRAALAAAREYPPPECSICRRRHGLEVQHAAE